MIEHSRRTAAESNLSRVLPQNPNAERYVIGSMLLDKDAIGSAIEHLSQDSFYFDPYRILFKTIVELCDEKKPIDLLSVTERLRKEKQLEDVGGVQVVTEVFDAVPSAANIDYYIEVVREKALLRELIHASDGIINRCYSDTENVSDLIDYSEQQVFRIQEKKLEKAGIRPFKELVKEGIEIIDNVHQKKGALTGVSTGFSIFDEKTSGLQPSDLIVIAARPSMGKTSLALNIALHAGVKEKLPVAIFSLEMSKEQLVQRLLCAHGMVNLQGVRRGILSQSDWKKLVRTANVLSGASLFVDDTPSLSALELRAKARRLKEHHKIGLIIVDYLQLLEGRSTSRTENRQQEISEISRSLKALARELKVPIIVLSQLNRGPEQRPEHRPQLSDLRESGAIEQDADVVVLMLRKAYYDENADPGEADIIIAKQRNGPVGSFKLQFQKEYTRFNDLSYQEEIED
ncbi:MAG: replicative DNA helicase [Candidatus Theseobacter exili]|nr:replicative DNA helicase [Candidatus Theseobacter exili]